MASFAKCRKKRGILPNKAVMGVGETPNGVDKQSEESFMDSFKDIKTPSQISIEKLDKLLKEKEEEIKQLNLPKIRGTILQLLYKNSEKLPSKPFTI